MIHDNPMVRNQKERRLAWLILLLLVTLATLPAWLLNQPPATTPTNPAPLETPAP